jgi:ribosomal protein S18 acetylase RimI-like enzyme
MSVTLRPETADDRSFVYRIYAGTREEELAQVPWTPAQKDAFLQMQFDAQHRHYTERYTEATFRIILADGAPAGRLYVARWPDEIRIMDIGLLPEYRGRGIGSFLLGGLLDEARTAQKRVSIHVERFNPALRLYQRLGFREVADRGVYLLLEWSSDGAQAKTAS